MCHILADCDQTLLRSNTSVHVSLALGTSPNIEIKSRSKYFTHITEQHIWNLDEAIRIACNRSENTVGNES